MRRFTQNSNYGFLEFAHKYTAFESLCSVASSYHLPFLFINMSTVPVSNITSNSSVLDRLLHAIITTGAHLNAKKWKEAALSFYSSMHHLMDFYRSNEENTLRRLKKKYSDEQRIHRHDNSIRGFYQNFPI